MPQVNELSVFCCSCSLIPQLIVIYPIITFSLSDAIDNMLFFGCRSEHADYFFAREWQAMEVKGRLQLFTAFSRDQEHKVYVQHLLREQGRLVWEWLGEKKACVFIAG